MSMEQNIRTFKDFLQFYNLMSQTCFNHCVDTFKRHEVEQDEADCIDKCATKLIRFNNRTIGVYAELQQQLMEKRVTDAEKDALAALMKGPVDPTIATSTIDNQESPQLQADFQQGTETEGTIIPKS